MDGPTIQSTAADTTESLALRVVEQIAAELDADPLDLDPLYETIDPDALDQLFHGAGRGRPNRDARVVFTHAGCEVTVHGTGEIEVHGAGEVDATELRDGGSDSQALAPEDRDRRIRTD